MKPRNKFEQAVLAQSKYLRPTTKTQMQWAFRECIEHYAYRLPKGNITCMDCGHSWQMIEPTEHCTCPQCGAGLEVITTRARKLKQRQYFTVLTTSGGYQVLRMYLLITGMEKGYQASSSVMEIGQYWWDERGRQSIVAVQRTMGHYIDSFAYYSPMAIRRDSEVYRFVARYPLCPKVKLSDTLKRNGFEGKCYGIAPTSLISALLTDSRAETLMKAGRTEHLCYLLSRPQKWDSYWPAYKITLRRGYNITEIALWCDYIDMLIRLERDIHNAHYVCPEDLQQAHNEILRKLRARQEREQEEHKRQKAQEDEARFKKLKAPFFGISFTDRTIQIRVLESVQEYIEEGQALHHCVFTNEYHLREKSLILSARIEGKRIETIEVSLETMQVIQCRGLQNKSTEYHDRIIDLVHRNIKQIQSRVA